MRLLHKALVLSAATLAALYGFARATIPPTIYVMVTVEDADGEPLALPAHWGGRLYMDDGVLRPGFSLSGTDDIEYWKRCHGIPRWSCRTLDGVERALFGCRPGAQAAFACMTDNGGADEATLQLPGASALVPWGLKFIKLTLPQKPADCLGELRVTVLDDDGTINDNHGAISLVSPVGRLRLLHSFGGSFGVEPRCDGGPLQHYMPAGRYRLEIGHWSGVTCGNTAPSLDRHINPDLIFEIEPGRLTHVTVERPRGTHLDLDLTLSGDGGEFTAARDAFLEEWELLTFEVDLIPRHRWRAEARLQRLDERGVPEDRGEEYACRWEGCWHNPDRHVFPVSGYMEGLRQYPPGRYRLSISGAGIDPFTTELELPDLDGGSLIFCHQLNARSAVSSE